MIFCGSSMLKHIFLSNLAMMAERLIKERENQSGSAGNIVKEH